MIARYGASGMMSNPSFDITLGLARVSPSGELNVVDAPYHKASGSGSPANA
jgi:hypothetical protein